ncbi:undecaprenyl/decaprenyl-phosphate alpha-N-acetylglucosaminyl 1-phosphate transferase [Kineobactrum salinum]|uniref:Undecaprenyl/decaprenyl-phosphate alpha-N-acetylglucosaminyl 1-phosphate transferase n=1 Tax=Kineobactrum salinum TaxID=2708301 RepID=A0A6C0U1S7_9GAMM|nr:undecaprenyl/decaprenyl-phosphate alpha-N-acetylglucosaminyl 1-phosphate transferase [Kineobactrum salinum]QIB65966.1 hypothetical protein G3T16_11595 [Kineobactrum salinum]
MSLALQQAILAFTVTLALIWLLARIAPRLGLMDAPNHRKKHAGQVPLVGGIAIFLTLMLCAWIWKEVGLHSVGTQVNALKMFMVAGGALVLLGVLDDRFQLSVFTRTAFEVGIAMLLIEGLNLRLTELGDLVGTGHIELKSWIAYPFTVVCIFGVINAYNMLDGMDGLLGIVMLTTLIAFHLFTGIEPGILTIVIGSSLAAFLISNLGVAPFIPKSFLGDAGSKLLGLLVVALVLTVTSTQIGGDRLIDPVTALYLLGLPLFDMAFTTLRRILRGKSPVRSDNTHIHHLMRTLGLSERRSLVIIGTLGISMPYLGLMLARSGAAEAYQFYIFLGCFAGYCLIMSQAWFVATRCRGNTVSREPTTPITDTRQEAHEI